MLVARFGAESVFKDVDDIEPGDDFVEKITGAVAACDVLLALIGTQWLTLTDERGRRRLDNPEDFVRLEVRAALSRGVRVVPILVDGAKMPAADQLPEELMPLTRRQAVEINPVGFNTDRLLATLAATFATPRAAPPADQPVPATQPAPELPPEQPWASTAAAWSRTAPEQPPAVSGQPPAVADQPPAVTDQEAAVGDQPPAGPGQQPADSVEPAAPAPVPAAAGGPPRSPETPDLPGASGRRPPPEASVPAPPDRPGSRRQLVLIAAGVAVVVLVGALLVLRPWTAGTLTATQGTPTPIASLTPTASLTPSSSSSPDAGGSTPLILAHRGGLEVHQFETQPAMEAAAAAGFAVETDVRFTSDGVAVLVHDEQATKGLDCGGRPIRVSETTWAELNRYCRSKPTAKDPAKYPVPKLADTLEGIAAASDEVLIFPQIKTAQTAKQRKAFLDAVTKYGLRDRTVVTASNQDWLDAIGKAAPDLRRVLFVQGKAVPASSLKDAGLWGVGLEQGVATKKYVAELKAIGVEVMIWVLNDPKQWEAFIPYEPDQVMTAYPAKLKAWLENR